MGPVLRGVVLMAVPVVILFLFLQRFIAHGLTGGVGLTVSLDARTTTAPSCTCSSTRELGADATVRLRVPRGVAVDEAAARARRRAALGGRSTRRRRATRWRRDLPGVEPVTSYRWVLAGGVGYGWVNGVG